MTEAEVLRALTALAQASRLQIFRQLVVLGPLGMTPGQLADTLAMSATALSFHLNALTQAGLITQERQGRYLIYRADLQAMNALLTYLSLNCCNVPVCPLPEAVGTGADQTPSDTFSSSDVSSLINPRSPAMSKNVMNVLFICTHNSARSIIAEALLNQLGAGRFHGYSAGSTPSGKINPKAVELLERNHYRVGELRSKDWAKFAAPGAPLMDFVLTVCDKAAGEVCPVWPGQPLSAHWGVPDPAAVQGTDADIDRAFTDAFLVLQRRVSLFLNLPFEKLERLSLLKELESIGASRHD